MAKRHNVKCLARRTHWNTETRSLKVLLKNPDDLLAVDSSVRIARKINSSCEVVRQFWCKFAYEILLNWFELTEDLSLGSEEFVGLVNATKLRNQPT